MKLESYFWGSLFETTSWLIKVRSTQTYIIQTGIDTTTFFTIFDQAVDTLIWGNSCFFQKRISCVITISFIKSQRNALMTDNYDKLIL